MSLKTYRIVNLHPNAINFVVCGVIIGKSNMSRFEKTVQQQQCSWGVVKFLLRDSCDHFINVTVWGTLPFITEYNLLFTIGNVIRVTNSRVSSVRYNDVYNPITSSPLELTINEGIGSIELFDGDGTEFVKLLNLPLKSPGLALNLSDIASSSLTTPEDVELVDLFVVVAKLKPTRQLGEKFVRDVVVIDQTIPGMYMTTWNEAWIKRTDSWNEMQTVLHLINVGFKYSSFHKSVVLVTLSRTIIIADPQCERSKTLKEYARNSSLIFNELDASEPDLSTIKTVMSIQQITDRLNDPTSDSVFYCLTFAMVTQMDIDGWTQFYSRRCVYCNSKIKIKATSCDKEECSMFFAENPLDAHFINYFNIPVHLTDRTGTLDKCRMIGDTAERILGCNINNFLRLSDTERSSIKWRFLMERCAVKVSVKRKTALRWNDQITIVDCQVADAVEVLEKIKVY